jgi:hypothetical protein
MSIPNPPNKIAPTPPPVPTKGATEIKVVQHSQLFYWWPVWAVGLLLSLVSCFAGTRMAVLPASTLIERNTKDAYELKVNGTPPPRSAGGDLEVGEHMTITEAKTPFGLRMASQSYLGIIFMLTLLLVIVITNVPLRGMWSVVVIVSVILLSVIFYLTDLWGTIAHWFVVLDIHINAAGYFFISAVLFTIWAITVFWFDQQIYIIFTPGLMKVREQIGSGETAYDASGMTIEHLRDDIFRHWILGLGSGDLVVHPAGPQSRELRLSNVLFVTRKLQLIENLKRAQVVVQD